MNTKPHAGLPCWSADHAEPESLGPLERWEEPIASSVAGTVAACSEPPPLEVGERVRLHGCISDELRAHAGGDAVGVLGAIDGRRAYLTLDNGCSLMIEVGEGESAVNLLKRAVDDEPSLPERVEAARRATLALEPVAFDFHDHVGEKPVPMIGGRVRVHTQPSASFAPRGEYTLTGVGKTLCGVRSDAGKQFRSRRHCIERIEGESPNQRADGSLDTMSTGDACEALELERSRRPGEDLRVRLECGDQLPDESIMVEVGGMQMTDYQPKRVDEILGVFIAVEGTFLGHVAIVAGLTDAWRRWHRAQHPERYGSPPSG